MLALNKFQAIGKYVFLFLALIVLANIIDFDQFLELIDDISWPYFLLVICIVIFDQAFMGLKWNILLRIFQVMVPIWVPILTTLRGRIFTLLAPSNLGIDAYKTYAMKNYHSNTSSIVSSIIIERGFGMLSSIGIVLLLLPFSVGILNFPLQEYSGWIGLSGFACLCICLHFIQTKAEFFLKIRFPKFFPEKLHRILNKLVTNLAKIKHGRRRIWLYFFLSIAEKASYGLAVYFSCLALGLIQVDLLYILAATPVVALLERLPISVSAIGLREGMLVVLLLPFFQDPTVPITVSLILRTAEAIQILIFSLTWFGGDHFSEKKFSAYAN